jgi:hypothetical protein
MQMIDVLKRLAELDAQNSNVVKESSQSVDECGTMGSMDRPSTPATINMTAATGEELGSMLKDIMTLAGQRSHSDHMDEPVSGSNGTAVADVEPVDSDTSSIMRSMMDKLNPENEGLLGALAGGALGAVTGGPFGALTGAAAGDSLTDADNEEVKEYDNEPQSQMMPVPPGNQDPAGHSIDGDRMDGDRPRAFAKNTTYESLMAEYRKFLGEEQTSEQEVEEEKEVEEIEEEKEVEEIKQEDDTMESMLQLAGLKR